jgi:hypothetical protein
LEPVWDGKMEKTGTDKCKFARIQPSRCATDKRSETAEAFTAKAQDQNRGTVEPAGIVFVVIILKHLDFLVRSIKPIKIKSRIFSELRILIFMLKDKHLYKT